MPTVHQAITRGAAALIALAVGAVPVGAEPASVSPAPIPELEIAVANDLPADALLPQIQHDSTTVTAPAATAFRIIEMRTDKVVRLIADHHGLVPHVSDRVQGSVSGIRLDGDVTAMMTALARTTDVNWFVYNGALEVSAKDETATRFVPLKGLAFGDAARVLQQAGLDTARIGVTEIADGSAVKVSGPPKAVEVVEAVIALTEIEGATPAPENMIVVRRGTAEVVESFGDAGVTQLNEDREAGFLVLPDVQTTAEVTAATQEANPPGE